MKMDRWIDNLAKALATGTSRRTALRRIGGGLAGAALPLIVPKAASAQVLHPCTLTCPHDFDHETAPGTCAASLTYAPPGETGACGHVTCTPPSGSSFPKGTTTVNCTDGGTGN